MESEFTSEKTERRVLRLKLGLLGVWGLVSFGCTFFSRDLQFMLGGWPLNYWIAAQGAMLVFIAIVAVYAWVVNRWMAGAIGGKPGD